MSNAEMTAYRSPKTVLTRFVWRRTLKSALIISVLYGLYVASKADGIAKAYPTAIQRAHLAVSFGNNIGLRVLFGMPHDLSSVAGFTTWNTSAVMMIFGGIWGALTATKYFRGEEENGRLELMLAGQTDLRRATVNILRGLGMSLVVFYLVLAVICVGVGKIPAIHYSESAGLFYALSGVAGAVMFMAFGALASQLMPTRHSASVLCLGIFGAAFLLRAVADITSLHWLLYVTPLGWIERLQPLFDSRPVWLVPIFFIAVLASLTAVYLAGRRDLGESTLADKDSAKPRYVLLKNPLAIAIRLSGMSQIIWLCVLTVMGLFFGMLTKSADSAFTQSTSISHDFNKFVHASQSSASAEYVGVIYFLVMLIIMAFAANAVSAIREDEASGYLDNLLVRRVGRLRWLSGRVWLVMVLAVAMGLLTSIGTWISSSSQGLGFTLGTLLSAGLNAAIPSLFVIGVGVLTFGIAPRKTTLAAYGVIGWSFLISLLSSGITLNHWINDTSILTHVAFAPASPVTWSKNSIIVAISLACIAIGCLAFHRRDIQNE